MTFAAGSRAHRQVEFTILFVCTGNHCRSPMAEFLLQSRAVEAGLPWMVSSAGTEAPEGRAIHPFAGSLLAERGFDPWGFRSQPVTPELLHRHDLILPVTDRLRRDVLEIEPRVARRTFTLRQLSHLLAVVPAEPGLPAHERGPELIRRSHRARTRVQPLLDHRDLPDPMGQPLAVFQQSLADIEVALRPFLG